MDSEVADDILEDSEDGDGQDPEEEIDEYGAAIPQETAQRAGG